MTLPEVGFSAVAILGGGWPSMAHHDCLPEQKISKTVSHNYATPMYPPIRQYLSSLYFSAGIAICLGNLFAIPSFVSVVETDCYNKVAIPYREFVSRAACRWRGIRSLGTPRRNAKDRYVFRIFHEICTWFCCALVCCTLVFYSLKLIVTWTKWTPFRRRHFQTHFPESKSSTFD